jgi:DNA polymerase III sliding clamp (beta) subunit (PCNA family)
MRFQCERETLLEAVQTAQRAVANRSGALPVLSDHRISATGDGLELVVPTSRSRTA